MIFLHTNLREFIQYILHKNYYYIEQELFLLDKKFNPFIFIDYFKIE